jgi:hypothetical protein
MVTTGNQRKESWCIQQGPNLHVGLAVGTGSPDLTHPYDFSLDSYSLVPNFLLGKQLSELAPGFLDSKRMKENIPGTGRGNLP